MVRDTTNKKNMKVYIPLGIVIIIVLAGVWFWFKDYRNYITTDDAHVDADNITVSSKMLGRIVALYADEGDTVQKGMLLAELDSSDLVAQRHQALAVRKQALANLSQAEIKYASDQTNLKVLEINLEKTTDDLNRAKSQAEGGVITQEQFDHISKGYETASAQLDAFKAQLSVSRSMIHSASAAVETASAQIGVLETQIRNTKLYSPANGVLARRWLLPGDVISPGQSVFTLTDAGDKWIVAFLEETKIYEIRDGQSVRISLDAFPHVRFSGKVFLVGSSTASVFSLIPANNASGNFTKVTQRIPVRISIDKTDNGKELSSYNILSGMSAVVKIIRR
jgi:membrane fusion protein (multidrug efflux system)